MKEREEPSYELGRFDRFIQAFRVQQRPLYQVNDDLVVPPNMAAVEKNLMQSQRSACKSSRVV